MKYVWEFLYYEVLIYIKQGYSRVKIFYNDKDFDEWMKENYDLPLEIRRISRVVVAENEED